MNKLSFKEVVDSLVKGHQVTKQELLEFSSCPVCRAQALSTLLPCLLKTECLSNLGDSSI